MTNARPAHVLLRRSHTQRNVNKDTFFNGTIFLGRYWYQKMYHFVWKNGRTQGPTSFSRCVAFFFLVWVFAGLAALGFGAGGFVSLGQGCLWCCNNTSCGGLDEEGAKKDTRKVEKLEKHAGSMKFGKTLRLFKAHLGIFSGLVDQGLVARCFRVL